MLTFFLGLFTWTRTHAVKICQSQNTIRKNAAMISWPHLSWDWIIQNYTEVVTFDTSHNHGIRPLLPQHHLERLIKKFRCSYQTHRPFWQPPKLLFSFLGFKGYMKTLEQCFCCCKNHKCINIHTQEDCKNHLIGMQEQKKSKEAQKTVQVLVYQDGCDRKNSCAYLHQYTHESRRSYSYENSSKSFRYRARSWINRERSLYSQEDLRSRISRSRSVIDSKIDWSS